MHSFQAAEHGAFQESEGVSKLSVAESRNFSIPGLLALVREDLGLLIPSLDRSPRF